MPTRMPAGPVASPLAPRKRPRQRRSAATVGVILEGAARILEERGLGAFTTNAVAERAGVSIGSLYQYFPGRDAILAALIRDGRARLLARVKAAVPEAAPPAFDAGLGALVRAAVLHQAERPRLARLLDLEERRLPLGAEDAALVARIVERVVALLRAHADTLPPLDPAQAAADVLTLTRALVDAEGEREVPDPAALERRVLRAVRGYLLWREPA